jgi:hypothetical protein
LTYFQQNWQNATLTLVQISSQLVGKYAYIGSISVFHPNDLFIATTAMLVTSRIYILGYLEIYKQVSAQMSNDLKGHVNYCHHFSSGILPVCKL